MNFSLFPRPISIIFLTNPLPIIWKIIFDPISLLNSLFSMSSIIAANIVESSLFDAKKSRSFSKMPMTRIAVCIWSFSVSRTITLTMVKCNHLIILNYPNRRKLLLNRPVETVGCLYKYLFIFLGAALLMI